MKNKSIRIVIFLLLVALIMGVLAGCGSSESSSGSSSSGGGSTNDSEEAEEVEEVEEVAWEEGEPYFITWENSIGSRWIQVIVPVLNTGTKNLYYDSVKLDLEDEAGHLIDSLDSLSFFPQIIQPGEVGYVYEETTLDTDAEVGNIITHIDFSEAKVDCIRFDISDLDIRDDGYGDITVTGRVENNTEEEETMVEIVALLFDENDVLIGKAGDLVSSLKAGEKTGFSATSFALPDTVTVDQVANYIVVAYPFQFQW